MGRSTLVAFALLMLVTMAAAQDGTADENGTSDGFDEERGLYSDDVRLGAAAFGILLLTGAFVFYARR